MKMQRLLYHYTMNGHLGFPLAAKTADVSGRGGRHDRRLIGDAQTARDHIEAVGALGKMAQPSFRQIFELHSAH